MHKRPGQTVHAEQHSYYYKNGYKSAQSPYYEGVLAIVDENIVFDNHKESHEGMLPLDFEIIDLARVEMVHVGKPHGSSHLLLITTSSGQEYYFIPKDARVFRKKAMEVKNAL